MKTLFYISETKATFNPAETNTPDTFISRGYDTYEEAKCELEKMPFNRFLRVVEHIAPELGQPSPKQPFGI